MHFKDISVVFKITELNIQYRDIRQNTKIYKDVTKKWMDKEALTTVTASENSSLFYPSGKE